MTTQAVCSGFYQRHRWSRNDVCVRCGLFRSEWLAARRSSVESEIDIARTIDAFLDLGARQGFWEFCRILQPNPKQPGREGLVSERIGGVQIVHESKGQPDRIVFTRQPTPADTDVIAIEIKTEKGRLSEDQRRWLEGFETRYRIPLVVRSLPELQERLRDLGVQMPNLEVQI